MIRVGSILVGALLALSAPLAAQQLAPHYTRCVNQGKAFSIDAQIASCTTVLQSSQESTGNRAIAFYNRGVAFTEMGDHDRAIVDYSEAIRLNPSYALAYNNRGNAFQAKGDLDRAIADYSEAIRLNAGYTDAYSNRGLAYWSKSDLDRAIADCTEAIRLNPRLAEPYNNRGLAFADKGDLNRAIADYNEAIRLNPSYAKAYKNRGRALISSGSLASAQADFKQASDLDPKNAYSALWLDLTERRNGLPSHLKEVAARLDMGQWPAPVVRLYMGELTPEQTLAAADHADPKIRRGQMCDANFYAGALMALQKRKDAAVQLLRRAAADCPPNFMEWPAARSELRLLGVEP